MLVWDARTRKTIQGAGHIHCTEKELAALLGVTLPTLKAFFAEVPESRTAYDQAKEGGRASLRRIQLALAPKNAAMAIFLGKNLLGQKDERMLGNAGGKPLVVATTDLTSKSDEDLAATQRVLGAILGEAVEDDDDPDADAAADL